MSDNLDAIDGCRSLLNKMNDGNSLVPTIVRNTQSYGDEYVLRFLLCFSIET